MTDGMNQGRACIFTNFFVTYEWTQIAGVLHDTGMERLASDKHLSLLSPFIFISYEESEVL
jgi:hypothetical protein